MAVQHCSLCLPEHVGRLHPGTAQAGEEFLFHDMLNISSLYKKKKKFNTSEEALKRFNVHIHSLWLQIWHTPVFLSPVKCQYWDDCPFQLRWPCCNILFCIHSVLPRIVFKLAHCHLGYCTVLPLHTDATVLSYYIYICSALLIVYNVMSISLFHRQIPSRP